SAHHPGLLAAACLLILCPISEGQPVKPENKPRTDFYGDPLPPGALARMGTLQLRHEEAQVAFARDGKTLVSFGNDRKLRFWDLATGKQTRQIMLDVQAKDANGRHRTVLSPDGALLAVGDQGDVTLYDTATGKEGHRLSISP